MVTASLDLYTVTINDIPNRYGACRGLIKNIIHIKALLNHSPHQLTQIWNTNKHKTISFEYMDKSGQDFYCVMPIVVFQIVRAID